MADEIIDEVVEQVEVQPEQVAPEVVETKPEQVPLAVLIEEKKKRKELERRLRQLEEKELDNEILSEKQKIRQKYLDKGYDESIAESLAEDFASIKGEIKKSNRKDHVEEDIQELSKDPYYSDALAYQKEIKAKIKEFKSKGIDLEAEDAYNLVRNPRLKLKESKEDQEQKELLKRREEVKSTPSLNASSAAPSNPYPLDAEDKKALVQLQQMFPKQGWTAEKYFNLMKK